MPLDDASAAAALARALYDRPRRVLSATGNASDVGDQQGAPNATPPAGQSGYQPDAGLTARRLDGRAPSSLAAACPFQFLVEAYIATHRPFCLAHVRIRHRRLEETMITPKSAGFFVVAFEERALP